MLVGASVRSLQGSLEGHRMDGQPHRVIATVGLHGSASTWAFNVVRELAIASFGTRARSTYADDLAQLTEEERARGFPCLIIKSHHGSSELDLWLAENEARLVLSIRDPRDAAISMTQRFGSPLRHAIVWLLNDCSRLVRLARLHRPLILRYEDRPFEDVSAVTRIADACGLPTSSVATSDIFERYRTSAVREFARALGDLPQERLGMTSSFPYDPVTQIHAPHIGDTRSGKWHDLPQRQRDAMSAQFRPYLEALGYADCG